MTRTLTTNAVKRIITKGLTGWEAGKLVLQDMMDSYCGRESALTESDMTTIRCARMESADVQDYNRFMALCRGFHAGYMLAQWACADACLEIGFLEHMPRDVDKRRTMELFESSGPHVVTRKQYDEIVAAQRQKKLEYEYSLGYVIEERFYAIAPPEARKAIDEPGVDIESVEDFVSAVPKPYADLCQQAINEIHKLHASGKLPAVYHEDEAKEVEPLLKQWKKKGLKAKEVTKLMDMLYVTGRQLHDCAELGGWKGFVDQYQRHWFGEDERFRHVYAVLEDGPEVWLDKKGHHKGPAKPSEWITRRTELLLGLANHDEKATRSVQTVGAELRDKLDTAEQNVRFFLAIKAVLDAAADRVGLDVPSEQGVLAGPHSRLGAHIALYNIRVRELHEERALWESGETRLEKALRMLPAIDVERLSPSPDSLKQLKGQILDCPREEEWLRARLRSLECTEGFGFERLLD